MRIFLFIAGATGLAPLSAAPAAPALNVSWGKSGVSFDQYRDDAIFCGRAGYYRDVSGTQAAQTLKRATTQLEANEADLGTQDYNQDRMLGTVHTSARIIQATRAAERLREIRAYLEEEVSTCLQARGYRKFNLTQEQAASLKKNRRGSRERHEYLYKLASDPQILATQGI